MGHPASNELKPFVTQLEAMQQTDDDARVSWTQADGERTMFYGAGLSGNIETTAMAAIALIKAGGSKASVRGALRWLVEQKDSRGTWHSTQATVLALKALLLGTDQPLGADELRRVEIALGGEVVKQVEIPVEQSDVMQQIDLSNMVTSGGRYHLSVADKSEMATGYQIQLRYHVDEAPSEQSREPLSIDIAYDRQQLQVDETISAQATVKNNMSKSAPMVMLDLPIPGGFAIQANDLERLRDTGKIAKFEVTPRQVIVYLRGLTAGEELKLDYRLKATMPVKVVAPPAQAYEYYNPDIRGRSAPARLEVNEV